MEIQRYSDVEAFYGQAEPLLLRNEAANCLPIGLCASLRVSATTWGAELPYFVTVGDQGAVIAAAMMTPPYNLVLVQSAEPEAMELIAQETIAGYGLIPGVNGPTLLSKRFADTWEELTGQVSQRTMAQRIYQLDSVQPLPSVPGRMRLITATDRELVIDWIDAFHVDIEGATERSSNSSNIVDQALAGEVRHFFLWEVDGEPVALAGSTGPTPHGMRIGPVYTPPMHRRKGYATACVAALSQLLLDQGRDFVFLFTDLANPTSNHIYQTIGYRPVVDVDLYTFNPTSNS